MMRKSCLLMICGVAILATCIAKAQDAPAMVKKAVERDTLDQPGTPPFHLKAVFAPDPDHLKNPVPDGFVEFWWQSPTRWRREVRSPGFHQILIVDGAKQWQKSEGDYFPEWLRELSLAIIRPVPLPIDSLMARVNRAEVLHLGDQTNISWPSQPGPGDADQTEPGHIAIYDKTGDIFYTVGSGWGGDYKDRKNFHGLAIARHVSAAAVTDVSAEVKVLEDLGPTPADFFDTTVPGGDMKPIATVVLNEEEFRKQVQPGVTFVWPETVNGPFEGNVWSEVYLDREGKLREIQKPVADNPAVIQAADTGFRAMQFMPLLRDGVPVQVIGRISTPFKTKRPAGVENFASARSYFENGRKASFLAYTAQAPYILQAEFQMGGPNGLQTGKYEDTWLSPTQWKREATVGKSRYVRSQVGDQHYLLSEGPEANMLRLILTATEPIPASDTMTESDWRIKRDTVNGVKAIRVFRGFEGPNGELDPVQSNGYWFADDGRLLQSVASGLTYKQLAFEPYNGVLVARQIGIFKAEKLGAKLTVTQIGPADPSVVNTFRLKGHEWKRAFTAEER